MRETRTTPTNPKIKISELGEEKTFVSGNKNWRIRWADVDGQRFERGDKVSWRCPDDNRKYVGVIEWMIFVDDGGVEVYINHKSLGRLPVDELKMIKKVKKYKDLFEHPEKMPKKLSKIFDRYWEKFEDMMDYKDTADMLKEVEAVGYTFDYYLDNEPFCLRPKGVNLNQIEGYEDEKDDDAE